MGNWDNQIDDVARQMTEGGPGGSFTARVLTRIDRRDPRPWVRRVVWRWSPVVVAVATALALVIALARWNTGTVRLKPDTTDGKDATTGVVARTSSASTHVGADVAETTANRSDVVSGFSRTVDGSPGSSRTRAATPGPRRTTAGTIETSARADRMESLEPSPILVAPLGVDAMETTAAIAVPGFAVSPLEVPALAIALLDLPAIGDQ